MCFRCLFGATAASYCWHCPQDVDLDSKQLSRVSTKKKAWDLVRHIGIGGDGLRGLDSNEDDYALLMQAMTIFLRSKFSLRLEPDPY